MVVEAILWGTKQIIRNQQCVRVRRYPYYFKVEHITENDTHNLRSKKKNQKTDDAKY